MENLIIQMKTSSSSIQNLGFWSKNLAFEIKKFEILDFLHNKFKILDFSKTWSFD